MANGALTNDEILRADSARHDDDALESVKDYHTTVTYLGAGALGFFLTIHEKFFKLPDSNWFALFVLSIICLFTSLLLYLAHIWLKRNASGKLRDMTDHFINLLEKEKITPEAVEEQLKAQWEKSEKNSRSLMWARLVFVLLGVAGEIIFIAGNLRAAAPKEENTRTIRIELPASAGQGKLVIDTSKKNTIQISF